MSVGMYPVAGPSCNAVSSRTRRFLVFDGADTPLTRVKRASRRKITEAGPNSVPFIDPIVATGYDYTIGGGDPKSRG